MPDLSFVLPLFLQSGLLPFAVALALLLVLRQPDRREWGVTFALGAGFLASYFTVFHAQWSFIPKTALDWLPWIAVFGSAGAVATQQLRQMRIFMRLALALGSAALVVWPALGSLGAQQAALLIAVSGLLVTAAWTGLAHASERRPTAAPLLMVVAGGAALTLMLDASAAVGQLSGALAAALAACVAFNLPRVRQAFSASAAGTAVLLLGMLLLTAYVYAAFSLSYVALLISGLLADPLVAALHRLRRRNGGAASWVAVTVLAAMPVMVVIAQAVKVAQESGGY